jgi:ankyrin repeat protein
LHHASYGGNINGVKALIGKTGNAAINARNQWAQTPLHLAAMKGHINIIHVLLMAGARPGLRDKFNVS